MQPWRARTSGPTTAALLALCGCSNQPSYSPPAPGPPLAEYFACATSIGATHGFTATNPFGTWQPWPTSPPELLLSGTESNSAGGALTSFIMIRRPEPASALRGILTATVRSVRFSRQSIVTVRTAALARAAAAEIASTCAPERERS